MSRFLMLTALAGLLLAPFQANAEPSLEKGKELYTLFCGICHGDTGDGLGPVGVTLVPPPRDFNAGAFLYGETDQDIFNIITDGAAVKGGSPLMAPWGAVVIEEDRWSLVNYVRTLKK